LNVKISGFLHQEEELSSERIHPLDVFLILDEERWEE
jgi:hypothetical protein